MLALSKDLALEQGSLAELEKRTEQLNQAKTEREEQVRGYVSRRRLSVPGL